ncbi:efflux RND transporter periplasmic adaptor subunit [Vibrio sp. M250220]|uniref:efflux RND transporter periplasmic adaptor subunit n=1 Tax=Vibrio sp. M250220 TaxID=3020894 RepID=UPI002F4245AD
MKHDAKSLEGLRIDRDKEPVSKKVRSTSKRFNMRTKILTGSAVCIMLFYVFVHLFTSKPDAQAQPDRALSTHVEVHELSTDETSLISNQQELVPVALASDATAPYQSVLEATGYFRAPRRIKVVPQVGGKIEALYVDIGQRVTKGEVLAKIDDRYAKIEHERAELILAQEKAVLAEIQLSLDQAKNVLNRSILLSQKKALALHDLEERETEVAILQARLIAQQQAVKLADADLRLKALDLKEHYICAAFSGVIVELLANTGDYIFPAVSGATYGSGEGLATLVDTKNIDVIVDISEKHVSLIQPGGPVMISGNGNNLPDLSGRVNKVIPVADRGRATVKVLIKMDENDSQFFADMGVRVRFLSSAH